MKKLILILALILIPVSVEAITLKATVFNPDTGERKVVEVGDPHAFDDGFLLEASNGYIQPAEDELGYSVITNYKTTLSRSITSSASTIYVSSISTKDSHTITMGDLGSKVFQTIEPGANDEEIVMCTGISGL